MAILALAPLPVGAETPFADRCEGNVCYQAKVQMGCLKAEARRLMRTIADRFGKIEIASACDGRHARRSAHYTGKAFDFRPYGGSRAEIVAFLKASPDVGGVGTYPNGLIHADVGDRKMAWFGRGGRAWPIGIDRVIDAPIQVASAEPATPGGLAAALLGVFQPARAASEPTASLEAVPAETGNAVQDRIPLPPSKPAFLVAASSTAPAAVANAEPMDFAVVLRGPLDPALPILLEDAATESPAATEEQLPSISFYRDDAAPAQARMIAFAGLR